MEGPEGERLLGTGLGGRPGVSSDDVGAGLGGKDGGTSSGGVGTRALFLADGSVVSTFGRGGNVGRGSSGDIGLLGVGVEFSETTIFGFSMRGRRSFGSGGGGLAGAPGIVGVEGNSL